MKWKVHQYALLILGWPFRIIRRLLRSVDWGFIKLATLSERFSFFRLLKSLEALAIAAALVLFWFDLKDRGADRDNRAWSLIASVSGVKDIGNIGVGNALEILNKDRVSLDEIHLPGAWLRGVDLSGAGLEGGYFEKANLMEANFSGANLSKANFSGADLFFANFSRTDLWGANLSGAFFGIANLSIADLTKANLFRANLSSADFSKASLVSANLAEADLSMADFSGADLTKANLSKADLHAAMGLTQAQIDSACYIKERGEVLLPNGFRKPPDCPK